jgi:hypothetical protein
MAGAEPRERRLYLLDVVRRCPWCGIIRGIAGRNACMIVTSIRASFCPSHRPCCLPSARNDRHNRTWGWILHRCMETRRVSEGR